MSPEITHADVATEHAASYMKQLCRHWSHKFPVSFDDREGRIEMPNTLVLLQAEPHHLLVRLELTAEADRERMQRVVAEHLQRFGFREQLAFDWKQDNATLA